MDRQALAALSARSLSREEMTRRGMVPVAKSSDLFPWGVSVIFWIRPGTKASEVLEMVPRHVPGKPSRVPRVTVDCWEDQVRFHQALGLGIVGRSQHWHRKKD